MKTLKGPRKLSPTHPGVESLPTRKINPIPTKTGARQPNALLPIISVLTLSHWLCLLIATLAASI